MYLLGLQAPFLCVEEQGSLWVQASWFQVLKNIFNKFNFSPGNDTHNNTDFRLQHKTGSRMDETKKLKAWQNESVYMTHHTDSEKYNNRKKITVQKDVYEYLEQGAVLQGEEAGL